VADAMCGTSAGAVNAVVCAYGLHLGGPLKAKEMLETLWRKVAQAGSFFNQVLTINYLVEAIFIIRLVILCLII